MSVHVKQCGWNTPSGDGNIQHRTPPKASKAGILSEIWDLEHACHEWGSHCQRTRNIQTWFTKKVGSRAMILKGGGHRCECRFRVKRQGSCQSRRHGREMLWGGRWGGCGLGRGGLFWGRGRRGVCVWRTRGGLILCTSKSPIKQYWTWSHCHPSKNSQLEPKQTVQQIRIQSFFVHILHS